MNVRFLGSGFALLVAVGIAAACSAGGGGGDGGDGDNGPGGGNAGNGPGPGGGFPSQDSGVFDPGNGGVAEDMRVPRCDSNCEDLSVPPIFDGVPESVASQFDGSASGSGPCIIEPSPNTMVPFNWTRPRVKLAGAEGTVYQIKVSTPREKDTLVAYTNKDTWILPAEVWDNKDENHPKGLTYNVFDEDITITVRAAGGGESSVKFQIAPVPAGGTLVFWSSTTTNPGLTTNQLYGFRPGDEGIALTLEPGGVEGTILDQNPVLKRAEFGAEKGQVRCVGCHSSTPDGAAVTITDHWPWNMKVVSLEKDTVGKTPTWVTPMGDLLAQLPWQGVSTYSKADWAAGNRRYVTSLGPRAEVEFTNSNAHAFWDCSATAGMSCNFTGKDNLAWINLKAEGEVPPISDQNSVQVALAAAATKGSGWGIVAREGDTHGAVLPDWSNDGQSIVYTHTDSTADGHVGKAWGGGTAPTFVDLHVVPFNSGAGGPATALAGAAEEAHAEYYPDFSADDKLVAFTRVDNFVDAIAASNDPGIYNRKEGEIYVVPATGGKALRLDANDPAQCTGEASPGVYNSWPKWSPIVRAANNKKYYFLVFSSARQSPGTVSVNNGTKLNPMSQLYMTTIVDDGTSLKSYGAVYLWNQRNLVTADASGNATSKDFVQNNVTPAWDEFQAPAVPPFVVE